MQSLREVAQRFGTVIPGTPRERSVPSVDALTSDERKQREAEGQQPAAAPRAVASMVPARA